MGRLFKIRVLKLSWLVSVLATAAANCPVREDEIQVYDTFNLTQFLGRWFEYKWKPPTNSAITADTAFTNFQHLYTMEQNSDTISVEVRARTPEDHTVCQIYKNVATLTQTSEPGKLEYTRPDHGPVIRTPYWVKFVDPTSVALVYSCRSVNDSSGICINTEAWIWSRTPQLAINAASIVEHIAETLLCLTLSDFLTISQDNSCSKESCEVNGIAVQNEFSINQFLGRWFEQKWLPSPDISPDTYYDDNQYNFQRRQNGSLYAHGLARDPANNMECLSFDVEIYENTQVPAKLQRTSRSTRSDFWVIATDYDEYAVVYGCLERNSTGQCNKADVWVWSRRPQLRTDIQEQADTILTSELCIKLSDTVITPQYNSCSKSECELNGISVQKDFDLEQFTGTWYELKWLPSSSATLGNQFNDTVHAYTKLQNGSVTVTTKERTSASPNICEMKTAQLNPTQTPGKLRYTTWSSRTVSATTDFWVTNTDYKHYAVVYGCRSVNSTSGRCMLTESWILGRENTLTDSDWIKVRTEAEGLCIDFGAYQTTTHTNECIIKQTGPGIGVQTSVNRILLLVSIFITIVRNTQG